MIKTVQVEERRVICDICGSKYFVMHGHCDTKKEGWLNIKNFATTGKDVDICPTCADFLKSRLDDICTKPVSCDIDGSSCTPVCSLHG